MRPVVKKFILASTFADYDVLRKYLFQAVGSYCSYCEQPISNDSAVEHKVPQGEEAGFPDYQNDWRNLLLGCQTCNSAKGSRPSKNDVPEPRTDEDWYLDTLAQWVWPDTTYDREDDIELAGDQTYRLFTFEHTAYSQSYLEQHGLVRKYWTGSPSDVTNNYTMTWIVPNDPYIQSQQNAAALRQRVLNTISNLNLNRYEPNSQTYNDRRVVNREAAYQAAVSSMNRLVQVYQAAYPNARTRKACLLMMIKSIRQTVVAMGFWSVWFWVFRNALDNPQGGNPWQGVSQADRARLLESILIHYDPAEQGGKQDVLIFSGTDTSRLNLNAFS